MNLTAYLDNHILGSILIVGKQHSFTEFPGLKYVKI